MTTNRMLVLAAILLAAMAIAIPGVAEKKYGPGVTDHEIKIGNIAPYTGFMQEYGAVARAEAAYFQMIDDRGGVNGRKINFVSEDDGSDSVRFVDLAHQLVEQQGVLLIFSSFGTEPNLAIRPYMNEKKVPQLFIQSSSAVFDDPSHFPWTMGFFATYRTEGLAYAKYILQNKPAAKIGVLYENTDAGKEYLGGLRDGLGDKALAMIVKEASYQVADPDVDSQVLALKNSGADVFLNLSVGTFATAAIRKAYDIDWHPLQFIPNASLSIASFLDPAGLPKAAGIITNARSKSWTHPQSRNDPVGARLSGLDEPLQSTSQPARPEQCGWLRACPGADRSSKEMRRRPDPRQCDEASREHGLRTGDASSGDTRPHQRGRLPTH